MDIPDIIGFELAEASKLLVQAGFYISDIKVIAPPGDESGYYDDTYRVIRHVCPGGNNVVLHVCKPL